MGKQEAKVAVWSCWKPMEQAEYRGDMTLTGSLSFFRETPWIEHFDMVAYEKDHITTPPEFWLMRPQRGIFFELETPEEWTCRCMLPNPNFLLRLFHHESYFSAENLRENEVRSLMELFVREEYRELMRRLQKSNYFSWPYSQ